MATTEQVRKAIEDAYDPTECESCELTGTTCWECISDAMVDLGN